MNQLQSNGNYPPGYSHSEYEADEMDDKPLSKMDEWYIDFEDELRGYVYEVYIKRDPKNPELINDPLTKEIDRKAWMYFKTDVKPEDAAELINEEYIDRCMEVKK